MDYPKFIVSNQAEDSFDIQRGLSVYSPWVVIAQPEAL